MPSAHSLSRYATQSLITEPGDLAPLLRGLPSDLAGVQEVARGLVIHYRGDDPLANGVAPERLQEVHSRDAATMLRRLIELQSGSLAQARAPQLRIVGCCRDFTVLFLMLARAVGIAARARVGFARYFIAGVAVDHEIAEVWDARQDRWRLVDPELARGHVDPTDGFRIDPLDVPGDRFLVAGQAWRQCRDRLADPEAFMVDPELTLKETRSWHYLQHNLVHDLAAMTKTEMLLWDSWGLTDQPATEPSDLELLDRIAEATAVMDPDLRELEALRESDARLPVPPSVTRFDPLGGPPQEVCVAPLTGPVTARG